MFVAPCRMSGVRGKKDAADAAAICEEMHRPAKRFVPVKTIYQQVRLLVHRSRQGCVEARIACIHRLGGLMSGLGIVLPMKAATVRREADAALEDPPAMVNLIIVHRSPWARRMHRAMRLPHRVNGAAGGTRTLRHATAWRGRDYRPRTARHDRQCP
jgi:transposase